MSDYVQVPTRQLNDVIHDIRVVSAQVDAVNNHVAIVDRQLEQLKADFVQMIIEQRQQAALQRALTEIIRVRQEVEQKFGNYKLVRDTMIGILQATDLSLIKESTLSRCTEELMISAPEYWLAPCLIALAGWISNNESLAKRAVVEAVKRDKEKTCLLFALICRRNGRTATCFEWLNEYFKEQKASDMNSSVIAFVDAYANGVFGEDKDEICMAHINQWMRELKDSNPDFDQEQVTFWKNYFTAFAPSLDVREPEYKDLAVLCKKEDFALMEGVISRLLASERDGGAKDDIREKYNAIVDKEQLVRSIDEQLKKLVTNYDKCEESLREEEDYLQLVKEYKGDEERATRIMKARKAYRSSLPVDFAQRLQQACTNASSSVSERKTAMVLLKDYILDAYADYVAENKDTYPETIGLQINEKISGDYMKQASAFRWEGKTTDGTNYAELKKTIEQTYEEAKAIAVNNIKVNWFAVFPGCIFLGIPTIVTFMNRKKRRAKAVEEFDHRKAVRLKMLNNALNARARANEMVAEFYSQDDWNSLELKEEDIDE